MRNYSFIFSILILVTSLVACSEDAYETGDTNLSYMSAEMVNMRVKGKDVVSIINDSQNSLEFKKGLKVAESMARPDTIYRLMLYYSNVVGSPIEIYDYYMVPMLNPLPPAEALTVSTDPLKLTSIWMSPDESYLNLNLGVKGGKADDKKHVICVTEDSVVTEQSGCSHHYFTLRHAQNDIPQYVTSDLFVSLPLSAYPSGTKMTMTINTFDGIEKKEYVKR